jgi:biopolymer transport protein ExbD
VLVLELAQALSAFRREQPVTVRADGALALTDFVELVDRVKALGFEKVALEVRRT